MSSSAPAKKRRRQWHSCDVCRSRKVKCDADSPLDRCSNCEEAGVDCTFNYITTRPAQNKQKMTDIQARLAEMEALLLTAREAGLLDSLPSQMLDDVLYHKDAAGGDEIPEQAPISKHAHNEFVRQPGDEPKVGISALTNGMSSLTLKVDGETRFIGNTNPSVYLLQNVELSEEFHKAYNSVQMSTQRLTLDHFAEELAYKQDKLTMPPRDITDHLVRVYFKTIHVLYPIIDKKAFLKQYHHQDPTPPSPLILNTVLACACLHSEHPSIRAENGTSDVAAREYYTRAQRMLDLKYRIASLETVQALVLLASHHFGDSMSGNIWLYTGMSIRVAYNLGLHRKATYVGMNEREARNRKLLWWHIYVTDRLSATALAKPPMIYDHDIDVDMPKPEDFYEHLPNFDEDPNTEFDAMSPMPSLNPERITRAKTVADVWTSNIHLNKVLSILLAKIHSAQALLRPPPVHLITDLDKKLSEWFRQLPKELKWSEPACAQLPGFLRLQIAQTNLCFNLILLLLHRPLISHSPWQRQHGRKINSPRYTASFNTCCAAAQIITNITQGLKKQGLLRYSATFYYYVTFMSSVQHLIQYEAGDEPTRRLAAENTRKNIAAMWEMRRTYINAGRLAMLTEDLLGDLESKHQPVLEKRKKKVSNETVTTPPTSPSAMSDGGSSLNEEEKARLREAYMPSSKVLDSKGGVGPAETPSSAMMANSRSLDQLAQSFNDYEGHGLLAQNPDKYMSHVMTQPASPLLDGGTDSATNDSRSDSIIHSLPTLPMFDDGFLGSYISNASMTQTSPIESKSEFIGNPLHAMQGAMVMPQQSPSATATVPLVAPMPSAMAPSFPQPQPEFGMVFDSPSQPSLPGMILDPASYRQSSVASSASIATPPVPTTLGPGVATGPFGLAGGAAAAVEMASAVPISMDMEEWDRYLDGFGDAV